jgi:RNA recognition motif-containing protein
VFLGAKCLVLVTSTAVPIIVLVIKRPSKLRLVSFMVLGASVQVRVDKETGHSRGFGFVNFGDERSMDEAIERLHGKELDGRPITVNRAKPKGRDGGGGGGDRGYSGGGGRGGGAGGGDCFKCGQPGHWARECPTGGDRGGAGSRRDRYGSDGARYGSAVICLGDT